jgi:hypothetical protein
MVIKHLYKKIGWYLGFRVTKHGPWTPILFQYIIYYLFNFFLKNTKETTFLKKEKGMLGMLAF